MLFAIVLKFGSITFLAVAALVGYCSLKCIPRRPVQKMKDWDLMSVGDELETGAGGAG